MWRVTGTSADLHLFEPFEPCEVLYEFDGPRMFTHRDCLGELCLAHWCDEDTEVARFVVAAFAPEMVERLKKGQLTLREALNQPRTWVVDMTHAGKLRAAWRVPLADLPGDVLPMPATLLLPSLDRSPSYHKPVQ